jgi:hypothetical protein
MMKATPLHPVTLDQRGLFEAALAVQGRWSCECNFCNLFIWSGVYDTVHTEIAGRRVVCNRRVSTLLFPFGEVFEPAELEAVRADLAGRTGLRLAWGDVPQEYVTRHSDALSARYAVSTTEDEDDYLLRTADLAKLAGRGHQNTRRLVRRFDEHVPGWRGVPITPANRQEALNLALRADAAHPTGALSDEADALRRAFAHFDALGLEGLALVAVDGALLACSLFSFTRPEIGNVHFEKADRRIPGAAQAMRVAVARHLAGRCDWLNIEQDMGVSGLRRSKRSYLPERRLPRYRLESLFS